MKTALDYARQALRFAERAMVEPVATAIRLEWQDAYEAGQRAAKRQKGNTFIRQRAATSDARYCAECAARHARASRNGGWWRDEQARAARLSAMNAARSAGYAAGVTATA